MLSFTKGTCPANPSLGAIQGLFGFERDDSGSSEDASECFPLSAFKHDAFKGCLWP